MTAATRALAAQLRTYVNDVDEAPALAIIEAATAIDALLDAIEAGGMVQPRPAPVMDLGPLRELRAWHVGMIDRYEGFNTIVAAGHRMALRKLNQYFPEGDRL